MILARAGSLSSSSVIRFDGKDWLVGSIVRCSRKSTDLNVRQLGDGTEWVWITLRRRDLVEVIPRIMLANRPKDNSTPQIAVNPINPLNFQE